MNVLAQVTDNPKFSYTTSGRYSRTILKKITGKSAYKQVILTDDDFARDMASVSANIMRITAYQINQQKKHYTHVKKQYDEAIIQRDNPDSMPQK